MVLSDFLTETRRRWLKAFKLFKRGERKSCRNKVSPALVRSPAYSGTVDARPEIHLRRFCPCRASPPRTPCDYDHSVTSQLDSADDRADSAYDRADSAYDRADSAYDSARSSPARPVCFATVTYYNVTESDDTGSVRTEYTLLDCDPDADRPEDERAQNIINESIELVSTL